MEGHVMTISTALRERFTEEALTTASGPKVIGLAYDRLDRDLAGAIEALGIGDIDRSHELLCHAQDIVHELHCMLDLDAWEHAPDLASIYRYVTELLMRANVAKRADEAIEARRLLAELGGAFKQAVTALAASRQGTSFVGVEHAPQRRLSLRA
jgi:flagellar protein FliS